MQLLGSIKKVSLERRSGADVRASEALSPRDFKNVEPRRHGVQLILKIHSNRSRAVVDDSTVAGSRSRVPAPSTVVPGTTPYEETPGDCRGPSRLHSVSTSKPLGSRPEPFGMVLQDLRRSTFQRQGGGFAPRCPTQIFFTPDHNPSRHEVNDDDLAHVVSLVSETTLRRSVEEQQCR